MFICVLPPEHLGGDSTTADGKELARRTMAGLVTYRCLPSALYRAAAVCGAPRASLSLLSSPIPAESGVSPGTTELVAYRRLPSEIYQSEVASGARVLDPAQVAVLPLLNALASSLPGHARAMQRYTAARKAHNRNRLLTKCALAEQISNEVEAEANGTMSFTRKALRWIQAEDVVRLERADERFLRENPAPSAPVPPQGLFLYGSVGRGKTSLVDTMFEAVEPWMPPGSCARLHWQSFMLGVYDKLFDYDAMTVDERERRGFEQPLDAVAARLVGNATSEYGGLLCFDEFVVTDVADARLTQGTLERLMAAGVVVTLTANRPPHETDRSHLRVNEDWRRFLGFLDERCVQQELEGVVDYRYEMHAADVASVISDSDGSADSGRGTVTGRVSNQCVFPECTPDSVLHELWEREAGCCWDEVVTAQVPVAMGRRLVVERASAGNYEAAAQLTADDLLGQAVGPADYIALAKRFRVIFVSDALVAGGGGGTARDARDGARRFVWLVDALYSHGSRIVVRAGKRGGAGISDVFSENVFLRGGAGAEIAEGVQFETEVARTGIGSDNRDVSAGGSLYTADDEIFALRRARSRLLEMQTAEYRARRECRL
jgi:predicted ATPase